MHIQHVDIQQNNSLKNNIYISKQYYSSGGGTSHRPQCWAQWEAAQAEAMAALPPGRSPPSRPLALDVELSQLARLCSSNNNTKHAH